MENNICVLIMAGGSGERFWPLSTKERPKQLLRLIDTERSLIRMTVDRVLDIVESERIFVGTNAVQAEAVMEELPMLSKENIIIEPAFRDTAAAIGFGSLIIDNKYKDSTIIVLASDHIIEDEEEFRRILLESIKIASENNSIITLGIKPTGPETGYGYLEIGENTEGEARKVVRFCEKPDLKTAKEYIRSQKHLWNSGMFVFGTKTIFSAFEEYMPNHYKTLKDIQNLRDEMRNPDSKELKELFNNFEKISIDYGIMEKYPNTMVIPSDFGWNDIGSYTALADVFEADEDGNIIKGEIKNVDSKNNIIIDSGGKKISILGIEGLIIVQSENDILITTKESAQDIKKLLK